MMSPANQTLAEGLVDPAYVRSGAQSLSQRARLVTSLLSHRRIPEEGWPEPAVESLLHELAEMDSNNFAKAVGLGEREARIASPLVRRMHYGLGHGIGRSGEIAAVQPKVGDLLFIGLQSSSMRRPLYVFMNYACQLV